MGVVTKRFRLVLEINVKLVGGLDPSGPWCQEAGFAPCADPFPQQLKFGWSRTSLPSHKPPA